MSTSSIVRIRSSLPTTSDDRMGKSWYDNPHAKHTIMSTASAFYALVLTMFALVYELAHLLASEQSHLVRVKDLIMGAYMYGLGIAFLCFCYYEIWARNRYTPTPQKVQNLIRLSSIESDPRSSSDSAESISLQEILTAGSLFLRIGCFVFGIMGIIYYALAAVLCLHDDTCKDFTAVLYFLAIVFILIQGHFILCNWKISETKSYFIARFGTMHLVGANLWTWFRFILVEEAVMHGEVHEIFDPLSSTESTEPEEESMKKIKPIIYAVYSSGSHECQGSECLLDGVSGFMFTSLVEYSLIGAAVMYIVWRNIKHKHIKHKNDDENDHTPKREKTEILRVNFKNTFVGIFLGIIFFVLSITSMLLYYVYTTNGNLQTSTYIFSITDLSSYVVMSIVCLFALFQMRALEYIDPEFEKYGEEESQELLDIILLCVGMIGEMIYSGSGLVGLTHSTNWDGITFVIAFTLVFRLIQVSLQSILIYISQKLRMDKGCQFKQPGKQAIIFLLIGNIAMFSMNFFESEKFGVSETVVAFFGRKTWVYLVRSFSPLTIFYRFHSSVCLAEIWRNIYAERVEK